MTKYFAQDRDVSRPLVEVPPNEPWHRRLAPRLFSGYLWFLFAFGAFAIVVWLLAILLG